MSLFVLDTDILTLYYILQEKFDLKLIEAEPPVELIQLSA
jgi:hypothetical protein